MSVRGVCREKESENNQGRQREIQSLGISGMEQALALIFVADGLEAGGCRNSQKMHSSVGEVMWQWLFCGRLPSALRSVKPFKAGLLLNPLGMVYASNTQRHLKGIVSQGHMDNGQNDWRAKFGYQSMDQIIRLGSLGLKRMAKLYILFPFIISAYVGGQGENEFPGEGSR